MNLGDFELRGDRSVNGDKLAFAAQKVEELAQVVHGSLGGRWKVWLVLNILKSNF